MRFLLCAFLLSVFCTLPAAAQGRVTPIPPGNVQAARAENAPLEPPRVAPRRSVSPEKLAEEAQTLQKLSNAVQAQLIDVSKGLMPKDLPKNLKELEKLAKKIRSEVSR
jgi:hypothetical protein